MRQDFSNVTPEQLAALFPVLHAPHDPAWADAYAEEVEAVRSLFGSETILRVQHIGSTAVRGLVAKPTVDMLVEIREDTDIAALTERMAESGYAVNTPPGDLITYLKGYTPRGFEGQAFHIHVRHAGDWGEPYFRDYLIDHPDTAAAYGLLKRRLIAEYPNDRDGYTIAKGEFVAEVTEKARAAYAGRYAPGPGLVIRPLAEADLPNVDAIDAFAGLQLRYHAGVRRENAFSAAVGEAILGVGYLTLHPVEHRKGRHRVDMTVHIAEGCALGGAAQSQLTDALLRRFDALRAESPEMQLCVCHETIATGAQNRLLDKGFSFAQIIPCMAFDLQWPLPPVPPLPEGIAIAQLDMSQGQVAAYLAAAAAAGADPDSEADIRFMSGHPSFACYVAWHEGAVVGAVSIWDIAQGRAATENIFVAEGFRKQGIARALIGHALAELKARGKDKATLSVLGTNLRAMRLYRSIGYTVWYHLLEMRYEGGQ